MFEAYIGDYLERTDNKLEAITSLISSDSVAWPSSKSPSKTFSECSELHLYDCVSCVR